MVVFADNANRRIFIGPFNCEEDLNNTLIAAYLDKMTVEDMRPYLSDLLSQDRHRIVFTHGDIRPSNVIIRNGDLSGIIDWEMSGWYPEYWEFTKALYNWRWQDDWGTYLLRVLKPYHRELLSYKLLAEVLW